MLPVAERLLVTPELRLAHFLDELGVLGHPQVDSALCAHVLTKQSIFKRVVLGQNGTLCLVHVLLVLLALLYLQHLLVRLPE